MSKKKKGKPHIGGRRKFDAKQLKERIVGYLDSNMSKAYSSKQIIKRLNLRDAPSKAAVQPLLDSLEQAGKIEKIRHSYKSLRAPDFVKGVVDHVNPRFAYVITDSEHEDVWVKTELLKYAMDGDTVEIMVSPSVMANDPKVR